jgi:hypothetical protein
MAHGVKGSCGQGDDGNGGCGCGDDGGSSDGSCGGGMGEVVIMEVTAAVASSNGSCGNGKGKGCGKCS